ncbi:flavodoxin-dependent (E)-4-hydroxy-3-methylbut-2-enyl-diphosphate synthase [Caldisericum exile]|uniref:4-hydroxy-3-methylbut-2-en-1-yl diphosphate synthase (flavodoxin) n=1 Tax=Caldisericum exile (strain DSM 21853 / NBRC 104410 / AZM16c01) TaxID=511051 RepID=A0A7U6GEK0_CALEA|nr:flavodoxin-dependent (E)-4-hydroxy-3-methylbut-2-enyl-diphosphate synthase [Caldisericum exile]BAL80938.1 4-hydroxy-3-methylbut-2-en-1-yl diphosphate synthase [Caldisericum exile AZM16c01]
MRKIKKEVRIGDILIGGNNPIRVQSMSKTDTRDVEATVNQILMLEDYGCELIRVAVKDLEAAAKIKEIKKKIHIPLIADIHFDPRVAIESVINGADKIRLNPSNITDRDWIKKIAMLCKERGIPIRIGANLGSFKERPKNLVEALVNSVKNEIRILNSVDFDNIVISAKTSDVLLTVEVNRIINELFDYPIHIGITEAGPLRDSLVKSSVGLGILLNEGIGDTLRVSITGDPVEEVIAGYNILKALGLRKHGIEIISCPTCGRAEVEIEEIVKKLNVDFGNVNKSIKVAVMGCVVNGPGEAKDADVGVACGKDSGVLFKKGKIKKILKENEIYPALKDEIENILNEN